MRPVIYNYDKFSTFFRDALNHERRTNPNFSLDYFCASAGLRSPSLVSWLTTGKRMPTPPILDKVSSYLGLSQTEREYAEVLIYLAKARSDFERDVWLQRKAEMQRSLSKPTSDRDGRSPYDQLLP